MKRNPLTTLIGLGLVLLSVILIFVNTTVSGWGFYRIGRVSTGGILIVLLVLAAIALFVRPSNVTVGILAVVVALIVLSLLLGLHLHLRHMGLMKLVLIIAPMVIGVGMIVRDILPGGK